jgi:hypothetical protein
LDDVPEERLPVEQQDLEAAAALAEMAAALADAAAPPSDEGAANPDGPAPETPPICGGRLRKALLPMARLDPRHLSLRRVNLRRLNPRTWARPKIRLDRQRSRRRTAVVLLGAVLVLALAGAAAPPAGQKPVAARSLVAAASRPAGASGAAATPSAAAPSVDPNSSPTTAPSPIQAPGSSVPPQTSPTATVTFANLIVDSALDFPHPSRVFTFTSDGPGAVSAQIVSSSPMASTDLCVIVDGSPAQCNLGATPELTLITTSAHSNWEFTLIAGLAAAAPVDVQFSWPTDNPQITVDHARFQGYPNPDSLRTLSAVFRTRQAGAFDFEASWPPASARATLTVTNLSSRRQTTVDEIAYPAGNSLSPAYSRVLNGGQVYRVDLFNGSPDGARGDLEATISFH